jgi:hypothetical protein
MRAVVQFGGLSLAFALVGLAADQKNAAKNAPPPRPAVIRPAIPRNTNPNARLPRPQMGPPLSNPASLAARLYKATPQERDRALEKLPPNIQEQLRKQLDTFDAMPKEQQQVFIRRAERFAAQPPARQAAIRAQIQALGKLPQDRRQAINIALRRLQPLPDDQRQKVLNGEEFKSRFSPEEQKIIADLSEVMLPPM